MRSGSRYGRMNGQTIHMSSRHIQLLKSIAVWMAVTLLFIASQLLCPSCIQAGSYEEYQVKAAFLHKFAKFIEWPSTAFSSESDPFMLCVSGKDPFGKALDTLQEGKVQFEINPQAIRQAGLAVSSQLLKVSKVIGEGK